MDDCRLLIRVHALKRMAQRGISEGMIRHALTHGEAIEEYPEDSPFPSRLILAWHDARPIHVVVAEDPHTRTAIIITVYEPSAEKWEPGFRRRKRI